jgi:Outer membrane protein beta-barrel domain
MKKHTLLVVLAVFAFAPMAFSQISGGIRFGANIANQKYDADGISVSPDSKLGLLGGLYLTASLSDKIAIQPELHFSSMGSKVDFFGEEAKTKLNYLSVPVLLRYNITENFNLQVGPQLGLLMSAKTEVDGDSEDVKDLYKGIDFGAAIGLGVDFGKINGGLRYVAGLSNTADSDGDIDSSDFTVKNNSFQIFIGYRLFGGE